MTGSRSGPSVGRLLTFVDAIVAIAITLLVLPLVDLTGSVDRYGSVPELLRENSADFWAFLLSFFVVSRFWFVQHESVRHLRASQPRVASLLMTWALTIAFLPFPTALVAEASDEPVTKVLYLGTLTATMLVMAALEEVMRRHPEVTDGDPDDDLDPVDGLAHVAVLVLALVVMLAVPSVSYLPMLLLFLAGPLAARWRRLRRRPAPR